MDAVNGDAPATAPGMFATMGYAFVWYSSQNALVRGAVTGVSICFALAMAVLVLITGNVLVSLYAVLTIAGIVVSVMGVVVKGFMGWEFGIGESVAIVIMIGFSMDYCIHIAGSYMESPRAARLERLRDSVTHMGISITAGAVTTLFSAIFLFGATMTFFTKFAIMITATVLFAYLWAVLFFTSLLATWGPEGTQGDVRHYLGALRRRVARRERRVSAEAEQPRAEA